MLLKYIINVVLFLCSYVNWINCDNTGIKRNRYELDDLYFEIIEPSDIKYTYRIRQAKTFGSSFKSSFENVLLVPVDPFDGCEPIRNEHDIQGNVAFMIRG
jgi:hypothetical protein